MEEDDEEVWIFNVSECPPSSAVKLVEAELGPAILTFVTQLLLPHHRDGILYEILLGTIAATLVEWTDLDFKDDGSFGAEPVW